MLTKTLSKLSDKTGDDILWKSLFLPEYYTLIMSTLIYLLNLIKSNQLRFFFYKDFYYGRKGYDC